MIKTQTRSHRLCILNLRDRVSAVTELSRPGSRPPGVSPEIVRRLGDRGGVEVVRPLGRPR